MKPSWNWLLLLVVLLCIVFALCNKFAVLIALGCLALEFTFAVLFFHLMSHIFESEMCKWCALRWIENRIFDIIKRLKLSYLPVNCEMCAGFVCLCIRLCARISKQAHKCQSVLIQSFGRQIYGRCLRSDQNIIYLKCWNVIFLFTADADSQI